MVRVGKLNTLIVIPARLESTRLPRKLLLAETGKPLLQHTYVQACKVPGAEVNVICDCNELHWQVIKFVPAGDHATSLKDHPNGTSRVAEAFEEMIADYRPDGGDNDAIVVLQADEPEIDPVLIGEVVTSLDQHPEWDCATAARKNLRGMEREDVDSVKVGVKNGVAFGFTRCLEVVGGCTDFDSCEAIGIHVGIYAYRRDALLKYAAFRPCEREQTESLEQLRALYIGLKMGVVLWEGDHHGGIDTREDYDAFVSRWKAANQ